MHFPGKFKSFVIRKLGLRFFILIFTLFAAYNASASIINAPSCGQADVQAAVDKALSGDTVRVPAGSSQWDKMLSITKGINLIGSGRDNTIITMGFEQVNGYACTSAMNFLVKYAPAEPTRIETIKISGFTFDLANRGQWASFGSDDINNIDTVIISNNTIKNGSSRGISFCDTFYGVVYNNIFESLAVCITTYGYNVNAWKNLTYTFGTGKTIFYEDNLFVNGKDCFQDSGQGGRFVSRFNEYNTDGLGGLYPAIDAHGNQGVGSNESIMGFEIYGNTVTNRYLYSGSVLNEQRGGKAMVWGNQINVYNGSTSGSPQIWEEYDDYTSAVPVGPDGQPQHVSDSYYWQNYNNKNGRTLIKAYVPVYGSGTATGGGQNYIDDISGNMSPCASSCGRRGVYILSGTGAGQLRNVLTMSTTRAYVASDWDIIPDNTSVYKIEFDCCDAVAENSEFWNENSNFEGNAGVGVGLLSNRPVNCVEGVGYWATDQGEWNSKNPGPDGTFYKCVSKNSWEPYYTPYPYPHPLRNEEGGIIPNAPKGLTVR